MQLYELLKCYRHYDLLIICTSQDIAELFKGQRNLF